MAARAQPLVAIFAVIFALSPLFECAPKRGAGPLGDQARGHIPSTVRRVGTPGISLASLILLLSGPQKLVAISPEVRANPWLHRIVPPMAQTAAPFVHHSRAHIESLLPLLPDLVVLWTGQLPLVEKLNEVGIPSLSVSYATPKELKQTLRTLGQALGPAEEHRAEELILYYESNLHRTAQALALPPAVRKPRVYYAALEPLRSEGQGSMVDAWISDAGAVNIAAEAGLVRDGLLPLETILRFDPEIIVVLAPEVRQAIIEDPRWQGTTAVKQGQVLVNPKGVNAWCTRAAETALQVLWAAQLFHPERMAGLDLVREVHDFHRRFYGYQLSAAELTSMLRGEPPPTGDATPPAFPDRI